MKMLTLILLAAAMCISVSVASAQEEKANYDEAKVPQYTLPDPLICLDGAKVTDAAAWTAKRRPEILRLFRENEYGISPGLPESVSYHTFDSTLVMDGKAVRKQVTVTLKQAGKTLDIDVLLYIPTGLSGPAPAFLGLNFGGNHAVRPDPAIKLNTGWFRNNEKNGYVNNRATEATRGGSASRWDVEEIVARGYALATAYYGDIDPDYDDGFANGVHGLFDKPGQTPRPGDAWGSIAGWAWGLSRILDYLQTDPGVDGSRVAVIGHSRLGKTSLWAGAQDQRFAMVISNNSGCGGAALSRRAFGETVKIINTSFTHWFCDNFNKYNDNEAALPVDQHMLLALAAPRPVYVASAVEDQWADPHGEFLSLVGAAPVYKLLTGDTFVTEMPAVDQPVTGRMSYHVRSGGHDVKDFDWQQYLKVADMFLKK